MLSQIQVVCTRLHTLDQDVPYFQSLLTHACSLGIMELHISFGLLGSRCIVTRSLAVNLCGLFLKACTMSPDQHVESSKKMIQCCTLSQCICGPPHSSKLTCMSFLTPSLTQALTAMSPSRIQNIFSKESISNFRDCLSCVFKLQNAR